jgi:hypothetical protein
MFATTSTNRPSLLAIRHRHASLCCRPRDLCGVGGVFNSSVHAPDGARPPQGTFEVGYQIACGEDFSTGPGIMLPGNVGLLPGAGLSMSLKPGVVNIIPVTKKEFKGADPWVMISGFSLKIDGCVGKSFHPFLRHTDQVDRRLRSHPLLLRHNQNRLGAPRMENCFRRRLQTAGVRGTFLCLFRNFRQASEKLFENRRCDMVTATPRTTSCGFGF